MSPASRVLLALTLLGSACRPAREPADASVPPDAASALDASLGPDTGPAPADASFVPADAGSPPDASAADAAHPTDAQPPTWQAVGPTAGGVFSIAVDPFDAERLYVGTTGWVYRSDDSGSTWVRKPWVNTAQHPRPDAWSLAPSPAKQELVYAGAMFEDVYVSEDRGEHWTLCGASTLPFGLGQFQHVVAHPTVADTVYVGVECTAADCAGRGGVYKSTDRCKTFAQVNGTAAKPLGSQRVDALAIDPTSPERLWAAVPGGILRTEDGGQTWEPDYATAPGKAESFSSLAVTPGGVVFAAILVASGQDSWLLKRRGALDWVSSDVGLRRAPLVDPNLGLAPRAWNVTTCAADPNLLLVATYDYGAFASYDLGESFVQLPQDPRYPWSRRLYTALANPAHPERLMLGPVSDGLLQSGDGGATWRMSWWRSFPSAFAFSPALPGGVAASLLGGGYASSSDSGRSWRRDVLDVDIADGQGVQIDPGAARVRYLGFPLAADKVERSLDGGASWTRSSNGLPHQEFADSVVGLLMDQGAPSHLFLALADSGVHRTVDAAASWGPWSDGLPDFSKYGSGPFVVTALALAPGASTTVWAGTVDDAALVAAVYARTEADASWKPVGPLLDSCKALESCVVSAIAQGPDGKLMVGTKGSGLFKLEAGTWRHVPVGDKADFVSAIAVGPSGLVAVGTLQDYAVDADGNRGVFLSRDQAESFVPFSDGLSEKRILTLAFVPGTTDLLAGTFGAGAFLATVR